MALANDLAESTVVELKTIGAILLRHSVRSGGILLLALGPVIVQEGCIDVHVPHVQVFTSYDAQEDE